MDGGSDNESDAYGTAQSDSSRSSSPSSSQSRLSDVTTRSTYIGSSFCGNTVTYYTDYLCLAKMDFAPGFGDQETPLYNMRLCDYAMFVRVVSGDPWDLKPNQYAFEEHYSKFEMCVQELLPSPVVSFIYGFAMFSDDSDPETNALLQQFLRRPHRCVGSRHCLETNTRISFWHGFRVLCKMLDSNSIAWQDSEDQAIYKPQWKCSFV